MSPAPPPVLVRCPAKINLFLEVVRRRADGYHDIDTVMQAIDLFDDLTVAARDDEAIRLACSDPSLPTDEGNLVVRAALALREATGTARGAELSLVKRVPSQAGLGGGSSDAAGTLVGLNHAWGLGLSRAELMAVAADVGSDVAFFMTDGAARCTGRGEIIEPIEGAAACHYVLVCPPLSVSTPAAYRKLRFPLTPTDRIATMTRCSLVSGDSESLGASLFNRLEGPVFARVPALADAKRQLERSALFTGVAMTGSGSALFGVCRPDEWREARDRVAALALGQTLCVRGIRHGAVLRPSD